MSPTTDIRFLLRLPAPLDERLRVIAIRERRSLNALIIWLLERAIDGRSGTWIANPERDQ